MRAHAGRRRRAGVGLIGAVVGLSVWLAAGALGSGAGYATGNTLAPASVSEPANQITVDLVSGHLHTPFRSQQVGSGGVPFIEVARGTVTLVAQNSEHIKQQLQVAQVRRWKIRLAAKRASASKQLPLHNVGTYQLTDKWSGGVAKLDIRAANPTTSTASASSSSSIPHGDPVGSIDAYVDDGGLHVSPVTGPAGRWLVTFHDLRGTPGPTFPQGDVVLHIQVHPNLTIQQVAPEQPPTSCCASTTGSSSPRSATRTTGRP